MALYSYLRANPGATQLDIEENLDGNLCRCAFTHTHTHTLIRT